MKSVGSAFSNKLQFLKLEISALVLVFCWIWIRAVAESGSNPSYMSSVIQGADDKLGQFLDQGI